ncbi:MAG: amidase [Betaproteobacteria bacterium]|nr:amidase [Betaproteobacteria bacterium]
MAFSVFESSIKDLHAAIQRGETSCVAVVREYIDRVRAFNGPSGLLVTSDGAPVDQVQGTVRAGRPLRFPKQTVSARSVLPSLDEYLGPNIEFGEMRPTAADPSVVQQYGMMVGDPASGQVNALSTLNIRGERSVVCRGDFDRHSDAGPLPEGAPAVCEIFRRYPDALEQAQALDETYGQNPDLEKMPLYGVVFSFKDAFDTKDMRSTGGADARFDVDFPARDHQLVERLREKGAIIFAKAVMTEYNGRAGDPGGAHRPQKVLPSVSGYQRSTWGGNPANPYDTARSASLGSSAGSAVSVSTNMVMASLGEETRMSTRGPSNHNSTALILPHKAMLGFDGGAIGADIYCDRTGIMAKTLDDCAVILDALRDASGGYYDPRDPYTTVPRSSYPPAKGLRAFIASPSTMAGIRGMRIGVIRESMLDPENTLAVRPIIQAASQEIKQVLGTTLGLHLVESWHRHWRADADLEQMQTSFTDALARLIPVFMPDILFRLNGSGEPVFPEFAEAIRPTEFQPGKIFGSGDLAPIDYMVALSDLKIAPPSNLDLATVQEQVLANAFRLHISQYLRRRAEDWQRWGISETLSDWRQLNARSSFWGDDQRAAFLNWEEITDPRNPLGGRQGVDERIMLRELLRRVDMMVLHENALEALVRVHTVLPPARIGYPEEPGLARHYFFESFHGPNAGLTEILVPAGFVREAYDADFCLSEDRRSYQAKSGTKMTSLAAPGLPFSLVFRSEIGREAQVFALASAYEKISSRRIPPPAFGPL